MMAVATGPRPGGIAASMDRRAPLIAALVALIAGIATLSSDPVGVFNDDGLYLLTARALAEGHGFVYPHLPGTPAAIHYPPLWPMLLAVFWRFGPGFPESVSLLKLVNPCLIACAAAGMVVTGRRLLGLPPWAALAAAVIAFTSMPVLLLSMHLLSEPLFLALLFPALLAAERLVHEGGDRQAIVAGGLAAMLVLTRTLGGVVPVATLVVLAMGRRWRAAAVHGAVVALLLVPWQLYVWGAATGFPDELRGSYGPYLEWVIGGYRKEGWSALSATLAQNLHGLRAFMGSMVLPGGAGLARTLVGVSVIGLVAAAGALLWRAGRARVVLVGFAGYLTVALAWPFLIDRFMWGVWPLVILIIVGGSQQALGLVASQGRAGRLALTLLAVLLLAGHEMASVRGLRGGWQRALSTEMTAYGVHLARAVNTEPRLEGRRLVAELAPLVALYGGDTVIPAEILTTGQHLRRKTVADHRAELEAIDARFLPGAFVVLSGGPYLAALRQARLAAGRTLIDVSEPDAFARILLVEAP